MALFLVTGGAGFIGSHVAETLLAQGDQVRVLDNFFTGRRENLAGFEGKLELIYGDVRDYATVKKAVGDVDYVLHLAAIPSVIRSVEEPLLTNQVNVEGTLNLLQASRECSVKRLVYASSSSVYGNSPELPRREEMYPSPLSPYSLQKLVGENYCSLFYQLYSLDTVVLRYFNVYGPRQDPSSIYSGVISRFITAMLADEPPVIYGDGEQTRDFSFVTDVAWATVAAARATNLSHRIFNIASGQSYSLHQLLAILQEATGCRREPVYKETRPGDVRHSLGSIARAKEALGFSPQFSFADGLKRTVEWYQTASHAS